MILSTPAPAIVTKDWPCFGGRRSGLYLRPSVEEPTLVCTGVFMEWYSVPDLVVTTAIPAGPPLALSKRIASSSTESTASWLFCQELEELAAPCSFWYPSGPAPFIGTCWAAFGKLKPAGVTLTHNLSAGPGPSAYATLRPLIPIRQRRVGSTFCCSYALAFSPQPGLSLLLQKRIHDLIRIHDLEFKRPDER